MTSDSSYPTMKGEIYEISYLKDTNEFDLRPWGMTIYMSYDEMIQDLENTLTFVKNHSSPTTVKEEG